MRELVVSNCEKAFLVKAATSGTRLDGRALDESRSLRICFGEAWGSCHVALGDTKVSAHVSQKIEQPKQARPNEGRLFVNVELGPMGAPNFDTRQTEASVYVSRLVEKCIVDSRCVDLESLCIIADEKIWSLRVDVHVLNHAGNLIECASIAALASLAHFKRPDVTTDGEQFIVHSYSEKDPIPTVLHHYPICVAFGFVDDEIMIADPNLLEETVCSSTGGVFIVGMNSYREICLFDLASAAIAIGPTHIYKASQLAAKRTGFIVSEIKKALDEDAVSRNENKPIGFSNAINTDKLLSLMRERLSLRLNRFDIGMSTEHLYGEPAVPKEEYPEKDTEEMTVITDKEVAALVSEKPADGKTLWAQMGSEDEQSDGGREPSDDDDDDDIEIVKVSMPNDAVESIEINSHSEEDEVVILNNENESKKKRKKSKK